MAQSVIITTPIPTLDEVGDRLGLSKTRRERLLKIVRDSKTGAFVAHENNRNGVVRSRKDGGISTSVRKTSK